MDSLKVTLGALLLFMSSLVLMETNLLSSRTPFVFTAVASLGLASGSFVVGIIGTNSER